MIVSKSLGIFRINGVVTFRNSYVKSLICSFYTPSLDKWMCAKKANVATLNKSIKWTKVNPVWRSMDASSFDGSLVPDVTVGSEDGKLVEEIQSTISSNLSKDQTVVEGTDRIKIVEVANSATGSSSVHGASFLGKSMLPAEKHKLSFEVGASLMRYLKGRGGAGQREIEEDMGVKIIFPSVKTDDFVIIEGISLEGVTKASQRIQDIIDKAVTSTNLDYSHFVSLPLAIHPELVDKLESFQKTVLGEINVCQDGKMGGESNENTSGSEDKHDKELDAAVELKVHNDVQMGSSSIPLVSYPPKDSKSSIEDLGIDKSIFIKPKTFHLTVLMLKLWNKSRVNTAAKVLESISSKVKDALDNRPVFVRLKGLSCMKGSVAKARVLYVPVEEIGNEGRLMNACQIIIDAFVEAGLVMEKDATQKLKLHATVMNARHRKGGSRWIKHYDSFDARGIFKQFGTEEWGVYLIREAHLSQRFAFDECGYYRCCGSVPFPGSNTQVD